jgi:excisionase family DNA binding protein
MAEPMYTPKQAADELGVSDQTVYRWIERGLVQVIARGLTSKRYLIPASEVERVKREGNYGDLEGKAMPALINA